MSTTMMRTFMIEKTGADGKIPAAPLFPPSTPFCLFHNQQDESVVVDSFNASLIGNNTNKPRNHMLSHFSKNSSLDIEPLRTTTACCSKSTHFTATSSGINNNKTAGSAVPSATCVWCYHPMCSTNSSPSTVYPSPELSDLDLDLDDDYSYGFQSLRRRPSLALEHNRAKRLRRSPSLSPAPAHSFSDDSDDLTVVNDTTTDVAVSSSPSVVTSGLLHHSILDSPPYQPADVFPDSSIDWHEQVVEYDWASSTDEDERKTIISDCSYWSGIDCRDESLSDLEARFGIDSPPYHPQDYNELDPAMDPQEARWFEQQLTTIISGSHRRQSDSPPYIPFDYNTLNSAMDPNEDRYFEQPRVNYTCAVAATVSSTCTDSESHEGYTSSNEISLSDDDDC